jgi:apolipoprotein N-acyltransferase
MLTGFMYFLGTVYWVYNSMYYYGGISAVLCVLIVILLCAYLALYVGIFAVFFNRISKRSRFPALFIAPVLWVTLEFVRTYALTGFPWSVIGYSQHKFLALIQISDITGVYGVSFLVVALNGAIYDIFHWKKKVGRMPLLGRFPLTFGLLCLAIILAFTFFYGVLRLKNEDQGQVVRVSVVQGNFSQEKKWDVNFRREIIDTYKRLTISVSKEKPELIIWPESALPFSFGSDRTLTDEVLKFQKTVGSYLLFGSTLIRGVEEGKNILTNSAVLLSPQAEVVSVYDKIHLVPYGEYVPLRKYFPFIDKLVAAIGDFTTGNKYTVMEMNSTKFGTLICYEVIFPGMVRKFAKNGAHLFVSITNDAWFGRTSAPYQHFSMAVFRAIENRVPVARAANTGISGFIDSKGHITKRSDIFVEAVMTDDLVIGSYGRTFYTQYGDLLAFLCIISCVLLIANNFYRDERR